MKKLILTIFVLTISVSTLKAQHDIKINALGLFFQDYGLGYEYIINESFSAGIFANYSTFPYLLSVEDYFEGTAHTRNSLSVSPEVRYYLAPDFGADKRYIGAYFRYKDVSWTDLSYYNNTNTPALYNLDYSSIVLGMMTGQKWVTNSGIYFETLLGVGKALSSSTTFSDPAAEQYMEDNGGLSEYSYVAGWDFRFQIAVGYRIGGY